MKTVKMGASRNMLQTKNTEIRIEALKAAAQIYEGKGGPANVIKAAKKFEEYLRGQSGN